MIVDDDKVLCRILSSALEEQGMQATCAHDGAKALQLLRKGVPYPDLLVLDVHIPHITGLKLLRTLAGEGVHVPTLLISALFGELSEAQLKRLGCLGFLEKPFDIPQFVEGVRFLVVKSRSEAP
jgi:DNA-binding response OmpR family regulator